MLDQQVDDLKDLQQDTLSSSLQTHCDQLGEEFFAEFETCEQFVKETRSS
jgi:hypothetical protein